MRYINRREAISEVRVALKLHLVFFSMLKSCLAFLFFLAVPVCAESVAPQVLVPFLYQVQKDGASGYILGTQHVGIDVEMLPESLIHLFERAQSLTVEIDDDSAPPTESIFGRATSIYRWWGPRLSEKLSPQAFANLLNQTGLSPLRADGLTAYGANLHLFRAQSRPSSTLKAKVLPSMDEYLARRAKGSGVELQFLETRSSQAQMLKQALDLDYLERSLAPPDDVQPPWFLQGDEMGLTIAAQNEQRWPSWWKLVIKDRNQAWLPHLLRNLSRPGLNVVAVGAMHLPTDDGVLALLRKHGFKVSRVQLKDCEGHLL